MSTYLKIFIKSIEGNLTKSYLISANIILVVFAIWFANVGVLPFKNAGDFALFAFLGLILALYRPGWTFVLFIGALALENVNLAPESFGLALRPYQFFGALTILALLVRALMKRPAVTLPEFRWFDALPVLFAVGGFLSSIASMDRGASFKQSLIVATFVALYFLTRIYVQSFEDLKRIAPFFLGSAVVVAAYGIWQNIRFIYGGNPFEVMPGRPNATFTEADWFGIYLVFVIAVVYAIIYKYTCHSERSVAKSKNPELSITGCNFTGSFTAFRKTTAYLFLAFVFIALILTVSRSAWLGAAAISILYQVFCIKYFILENKNWREFLRQLFFLVIAGIASIVMVYGFNLTSFQLFNRAASVGGLQKITIACQGGLNNIVPQTISSVDELSKYDCRHINLEDIEKEKSAGNIITEVYRPDPNVGIRAGIYKTATEQIRQHPLLGIGWGGIGAILGNDERGAGLNASNMFLEVWLGAGLPGILSFVILLGYIFIKGVRMFLDREVVGKTVAAFILLGFAAVVIPNIFNSGIFLGFLWAYLAVAVSLMQSVNEK